ncbi:MAG: hypothetical protein N2037_07390 [Acidimicrobiales bacterium]|nr:hypothetical protein [Acidimicrobiales bacterium]
MKKWLIAGSAAAAIGVGSLGVAAVNPLGVAGAGTLAIGQDPSTQGTESTAPPTTEQDSNPDKGAHVEHPRRGPHLLDQTLDELVANGVITQNQADAVKAKLAEKFAQHRADSHRGGPEAPRGPMGHGFRPHFLAGSMETAAATIGITPGELIEAIKGGKTIGQVAQDHGVDPQAVVDAVLAKANAKIDEKAAAGSIPSERVDEAKQKAAELATKFVNEPLPTPGVGGFGGRGHGPN